MRWWMRLAALVVLVSTLGVPLGVVAEGYVCASGMRMNIAAVHACSHCAPLAARAEGGHSLARACCTYVGSTSLPEAITDGPALGTDAIARAATVHGSDAYAVLASALPGSFAWRTTHPWRHPDGLGRGSARPASTSLRL